MSNHIPFLLVQAESLFTSFIYMSIAGDGGEITTTDMLIGIWLEVESPGHKIMVTLGFNDEKAKELESSSTELGYVDD